MDGEALGEESYISKSRLEALVDAVFAFAMTLLVISLTVPTIPKTEAAAELPPYLASMAPQFLSFLIAFFVLASFWVGHHKHFHYLRVVDRPLLWINLLILVFVVLVPFTTNLSGDYSHVQIATVFFHANLLFLGLLFFVQWQYLLRHPVLDGTLPPALQEREVTLGGFNIIVSACTAIAISFFTPSNSFYAYMIVPVAARVLSLISRRRAEAHEKKTQE
ncbi:MAG TPA: TMEM175 family protein [Methanoregula sp.]|nr:TMEM175 family protein [Methanoregula sp.]